MKAIQNFNFSHFFTIKERLNALEREIKDRTGLYNEMEKKFGMKKNVKIMNKKKI